VKKYKINEVFYSLQGEGARAGEASIFVRFSGCNLKCREEPGPLSPGGFDCDTEFESGRMLTADELLQEMMETIIDITPTVFPWVVFTGGEPLLQLDKALCEDLIGAGFELIAIETNGTKAIDADLWKLLTHIVCSPKVAEHAVRLERCNELRYVRGYGQAIPEPKIEASRKYISPAFDGDHCDARTMQWCVDLVKQNPDWRLSLQLHKVMAVR
jgi:organic radical activating enzyme